MADDVNQVRKFTIDDLEVVGYRGEDGVLIVHIDQLDVAPKSNDTNSDGTPKIRVWVGEALLHDEDGSCHPVAE